jgi:hypothetical protein
MLERATRVWLLRSREETASTPAEHVAALVDAAFPVAVEAVRDAYHRGYRNGRTDCERGHP